MESHCRFSMPYPRSFFRFFEIKICKNKKYSYLCTPNRWVRITVSTRDSQSRNRSSILLPSTKSAASFEGSAFLRVTRLNLSSYPQCGHYIPGQAVQVHGQTAQVPVINGAGSKIGAEPAPRIGLLRCSGGAGFGPKMEPAPFTAEPAPPIPEPAPSWC